MKKVLIVLIVLLSAILFSLFGANTSASINVVHTWTALQNFAAGSTVVTTPAAADRSQLIATTDFIVPGVTTSTSGPVSDPGDTFDFLYNNASGALTFNAPDGIVGLERCYRNSTGKTGAITIQMAANNTVDVNGVNGSVAGTLVSNGALGDGVCINSDSAHHWYASITGGTWTNN